MRTIYVGFDGTKMEMTQKDIPIRVPVMFKYYRTMDSFSLYIDPKPEIYTKMQKNLRKNPDNFAYAITHFICPSGNFSDPNGWEVENLDDLPDDMRERLMHYWVGYTDFWFKHYCSENTRLWTGNTDLSTTCYLSNVVIPEASNCTFFIGGECNGIRFSRLSNVVIHILEGSDYYEVE